MHASDPPVDAVPPLAMRRDLPRQIMGTIGARPPETGGILLGPIGRTEITEFYFDASARCTATSYTPDHRTLQRRMREEWIPAGLDLKGFVHSHPGGLDQLSAGDLAYIRRLLDRNPDLSFFAAPLVLPREFCLRTIVVPREHPTHPRVAPLRLFCSAPSWTPERITIVDFQRIQSSIDVARMQQRHATIVGGAYGLAQDLVRCGLGALTYVDYDRVERSNPARQDLNFTDVGRYKVQALSAAVQRINPAVAVQALVRDFCEIDKQEFDTHFGQTDLFIFATDSFPAQARGNLQALRLRKPAVWIGLYREGRAGEIVYWAPGVTPACYRCICSSRYRAFVAQREDPAPSTQVSSTGATILDLHLVDAIAGQIAVGLLTAGADNRMGRLIAQLGTRNLLQVKIDPAYRLADKDLFAQYLADHPANFAFQTIALSTAPEADCPDCAAHRGAEHRGQEPTACGGL